MKILKNGLKIVRSKSCFRLSYKKIGITITFVNHWNICFKDRLIHLFAIKLDYFEKDISLDLIVLGFEISFIVGL